MYRHFMLQIPNSVLSSMSTEKDMKFNCLVCFGPTRSLLRSRFSLGKATCTVHAFIM